MCPSTDRETGAGVGATPVRPEAVAHEVAPSLTASRGAQCIWPLDVYLRQSRPSTAIPGTDGRGTICETEERGERSAGCRRGAPAPAPAALPCQNSNNSDKRRPRYRLTQVPHAPSIYTDREKKHIWEKQDDDTLHRIGMPTSAEARSAFHLRLNVASFIQHWGRDRCLFFTVTDEDNLHPTLFARRWNNYLRRHGSWIVSFIRVLEPQKQGRPHYHLLVAVGWDTKPDAFDWQAFDECQQERRGNGPTARFRELRARYKASAAPELVAMWSLLRKVLPRYGLGRAELLPIRKGKEAISEYIGKYLEAGLIIRKHSWKGCRRVEFDRRNKTGWIACTRIFAWNSPGATAWRARVAELANALGVSDMDGLRSALGPKWAYRLRSSITLSDEADWRLLMVTFTREIPFHLRIGFMQSTRQSHHDLR